MPPIRPPAEPPPSVLLAAVRASTDRTGVRTAYLFEQIDERGRWTLSVGVHLAPGAAATRIMPEIAAALRERVPDGPPLRLLALSRRKLAVLRGAVEPLVNDGGRPEEIVPGRRKC
jgi:hypothetical protein